MSLLALHSILVIDDELELASLFKTFLQHERYDVISFTDALLALEHFNETSNKHSLIITDLRFPGILGMDIARNLREIDDKIKIFLITAFDTQDLED